MASQQACKTSLECIHSHVGPGLHLLAIRGPLVDHYLVGVVLEGTEVATTSTTTTTTPAAAAAPPPPSAAAALPATADAAAITTTTTTSTAISTIATAALVLCLRLTFSSTHWPKTHGNKS